MSDNEETIPRMPSDPFAIRNLFSAARPDISTEPLPEVDTLNVTFLRQEIQRKRMKFPRRYFPSRLKIYIQFASTRLRAHASGRRIEQKSGNVTETFSPRRLSETSIVLLKSNFRICSTGASTEQTLHPAKPLSFARFSHA